MGLLKALGWLAVILLAAWASWMYFVLAHWVFDVLDTVHPYPLWRWTYSLWVAVSWLMAVVRIVLGMMMEDRR